MPELRERPTLVTCRTDPRSAAEARAVADAAPFVRSDELVAWVEQGLVELA